MKQAKSTEKMSSQKKPVTYGKRMRGKIMIKVLLAIAVFAFGCYCGYERGYEEGCENTEFVLKRLYQTERKDDE